MDEKHILVPNDYLAEDKSGISHKRSFELCSESLFFHAEIVDFADHHLAHLESSNDGIRCIKAAAPFEPLKMVCNIPDSQFVKGRRSYRKVCSLLEFLWRSCVRQCDIASAVFLASHPVLQHNLSAMEFILEAAEKRVTTVSGLKKHNFAWLKTADVSVDECQFITRSVVAFVEQDTRSLTKLTPKYHLSVGNPLSEVSFPWTMLLYTSVHRVYACHEDPRGVLQFLEDKWPQRAIDMISRGVFYKPGLLAMGHLGLIGSDGEYFGPIPTDLDSVTPEAEAEPSVKTKRDDLKKNTSNKRLKLPPSPQFLNAYGSNGNSGEGEDVEEEDEEEENEEEEDEEEQTEDEEEETRRQYLDNAEDDNDSTGNFSDDLYDNRQLDFDEISSSDDE
jgi:hypothetical protein